MLKPIDMKKLHLEMVKTLRTTDYDELTAAEEGWEIHHRPVRPEKFEGRITLARIGGVGVDLESWSTATELVGTSPRQALGFVLPFEGVGSYVSSGMDVAAGQVDVFGADCEIYALTKPGASLISCSVSTEALEERADSPVSTFLAEQADRHRVVPSTRRATVALCRLWKQLLDLSAREELPREAHDQLLDEVLLVTARALNSAEEGVVTRIRRDYKLARRARDFMLERYSEPPSIFEICTFLNTSERTLHYAFSEMYGVTPKRFLKTQRLFGARQALKSTPVGGRVSDIALRFGFWDQGHFAKDYRTMFGELPSATLQRHYAESR